MSDLEMTGADLRSRAIAILKKRRDFRAHLLVYLLVNGALVTIWAMTDTERFFWPVFVPAFWGIGVVMNGWDAYVASDFSEDRIQREMHRLEPRH
jgi:hypothetical protein